VRTVDQEKEEREHGEGTATAVRALVFGAAREVCLEVCFLDWYAR
jgi:hypothetical protein